MPFIDDKGRPELIVHPAIKLGLAHFRPVQDAAGDGGAEAAAPARRRKRVTAADSTARQQKRTVLAEDSSEAANPAPARRVRSAGAKKATPAATATKGTKGTKAAAKTASRQRTPKEAAPAPRQRKAGDNPESMG